MAESEEIQNFTQNLNQVSLILMMGLPASGKTTLASKIEEHSSKSIMNTISISYDDFVPHEVQKEMQMQRQKLEEETPNFSNLSVTKLVRKRFITCVEHLLIQLLNIESKSKNHPEFSETLENSLSSLSIDEEPIPISTISNQHFVTKVNEILHRISNLLNSQEQLNFLLIIDDNNYYTSMRQEFYQLAKKHRTGFCTLYCKTYVKICRQRNSQRDEKFQVPEKSIVEMSLKLEEPDPMTNICDSYCILVEEGDNFDNIPLIMEVLHNSLKNPVESKPDRSSEVERERRICSENEVHQADQILRKWINKELTIKSLMKRIDKRVLSKDLNRRRLVVMDKLRKQEYKVMAGVEQEIEFREEIVQFANSLENLE